MLTAEEFALVMEASTVKTWEWYFLGVILAALLICVTIDILSGDTDEGE